MNNLRVLQKEKLYKNNNNLDNISKIKEITILATFAIIFSTGIVNAETTIKKVKGGTVNITENGLKLCVESIINREANINSLSDAHDKASQTFGSILDKYFKNPKKYYKIKPGSFKISDREGENHSISYEIELQEVKFNESYIRYSQTVGNVIKSDFGYNTAMKQAESILNPKLRIWRKEDFLKIIKENGNLCEKQGKTTEIQTLKGAHNGKDSENNIAFKEFLTVGVCKK